jgi:nucleoside-triphosphatase
MTIILITGVPGVGKTTFIRKIADSLEELHPVGFYTQEIRERGRRVGFEIIGLDGSSRLLSHVAARSHYRVGKYGVDIPGFEEYLQSLDLGEGYTSPVVIDEIGKMECYSSRFRDLVSGLVEGDRLFIATIARKGDQFIESLKDRENVRLFEVTRENRDILLPLVLEIVHRHS